MRARAAMLGCAALALAMGGGATAASDTPPATLPLEGASFGMTLDAWKTLPPPASAGPTAAPACWNDETPVRISGQPLGVEGRRSGLTTCAYLSRFGDDVLPHSVRLDDRFRATDLEFLFDHGRLAEVTFLASVDAYNDVTALLEHRFGAPTQISRESFNTSVGRRDRVREVWRLGGGKVTLVDPVSDPTKLSVDLSLTAAAATLAGLPGGGS